MSKHGSALWILERAAQDLEGKLKAQDRIVGECRETLAEVEQRRQEMADQLAGVRVSAATLRSIDDAAEGAKAAT